MARARREDGSALPLMYLLELRRRQPGGCGSAAAARLGRALGLPPRLTVFDVFGSSAQAETTVLVSGAQGQVPPTVRIVASSLSGSDTLAVQLSAEVTQGSAPVLGISGTSGTGRRR